MRLSSNFDLDGKKIGLNESTYFIADIAANHDGSLDKAIELIHLCAESGADAVKFQHFDAKTIVSDHGFKSLGSQKSHQSTWKKSVYEIYDDASLKQEWTNELKLTCEKVGLTFFTSPYSFELVDYVDPFVSAYKVGSGDINWLKIIDYMARKGKPMFLASGASSLDDVRMAMDTVFKYENDIVLMQCNTNYTASLENFKYINLNVLRTFSNMYPNITLGLSDHTQGHATVLGAVALGARVIEKHFTDDNNRSGPDHKFSMNPQSWRDMVDRTRELEISLGSGVKKVEDNEKDTVVLQRRSIRAKCELVEGTVLKNKHMEVLRPCPVDALEPNDLDKLLGKTLRRNILAGECIRCNDLN